MLARARRTEFVLTETGTARVTTPAVYRAGAKARVVVRSDAGRAPSTTRVGEDGRLQVDVPLSGDGEAATVRAALRAARR